VYSDLGWTWVSAYQWGAIPYHYGTWALDPELGWVWVPGYSWAPAWVVFRTGPSYVGWAPVPPGYSVGVSFSFNDYGADHFVFVREGDFAAADVHRVAVPVERTRVVFGDTTIVNNNLQDREQRRRQPRDRRAAGRARGARAVEREPIERVPKAAPRDRVTRDELRVDPSEMDRGRVRAAAPAHADYVPLEQRGRRPDMRQPAERGPEVSAPRRDPERERDRRRGGPTQDGPGHEEELHEHGRETARPSHGPARSRAGHDSWNSTPATVAMRKIEQLRDGAAHRVHEPDARNRPQAPCDRLIGSARHPVGTLAEVIERTRGHLGRSIASWNFPPARAPWACASRPRARRARRLPSGASSCQSPSANTVSNALVAAYVA
jgi:hypothetical protein